MDGGAPRSALVGGKRLPPVRRRAYAAGASRRARCETGYARLFAAEGLELDAQDSADLVLFPEMDETEDVPEITVDCWEILGVEPSAMMCATSRMVVKRRGRASPAVVSCTLLPYDPRFELGCTLSDALGPVRLNHPYCARFCVLGGASCGASS